MNAKQQHATPINILLADDDTDDCFFFEKALKQLPISTSLTVVRDGEKLINYLFENEKQTPDILFLDLSMPRKTGFECLSEIKENKKLKNFPIVVFTTSFGGGGDFEQSMIKILTNIGAQEYICKSSDFEQLKKLLMTFLSKYLKKESSN